MFSLLSPISLWFGALLAVPLAIHFLGRQRLERQPFPSLLLVKEGFANSMRRHRLKNLLLLIIRTLLIACILLALSNPAMESKRAGAKPDQSLALIHNGIYGKLAPIEGAPAFGGTASPRGKDLLETQRLRVHGLDSAQGTRTRIFTVIEDGPGAGEVAERFGDYGDAVRRLLSALGPGTALINLPVFAWKDVSACQADLLRALQENTGLQLALTDFSTLSPRVSAFEGLRATPAADAPTVALSARLSPAAAAGGKSQVWLDGRLFQEAAAAGGRVEVTLPLGAGPRTEGRFAFSGGFATADFHFCFPQAGAWSLAHAGSALVSLPSLGRETYFRRIVHVASAGEVPWGGISPASGGKAAAPAPLRLVYLAAERAASPEAYSRAVEFVKRGGRLIVAAGRESDIPGLNRFLLQPLRLGHLGNLVDTSGPVSADRAALARVGRASGDPAAAAGNLGTVRKRYAFSPDSGTVVLLAQGGAAVLAERDFHQGHALLWTTDIDDLEWTDLGVSALVPLLHQAFQEAAAGERAANLAVASDSIYALNLAEGEENSRPEARDPLGRPFSRVRIDGGRMRLGPFDKLGLYRVIRGEDTNAFAVNLIPAGTATPTPASEEWAAADAAAKEAFLAACKPFSGRIAVLGQDDAMAARTSVRRLWPAFLLGALLLLFLEGLVSSRFSARRTPN
ncbi:MAG: BatA domain-containing protein [Fibrobacteres bacterium]|nr:BatA domain-containing protein [Fibrobacterota bacterium]